MDIKRRANARILLIGLCFLLVFGVLTGRLWWLQSVDAAWIMQKGSNQWEREKVLQPKRGSILDRNGQVLAYEGKAYTVTANLQPRNEKEKSWVGENYVRDPFGTAQKLAPILGASVDALTKAMTQTYDAEGKPLKFYVNLGREASKITEEQKAQILALQHPKDAYGKEVKENQLPGISLTETTRRYYPNNSLAAHVLGYLNYEGNKAEMGIEKQFDKELRGETGELQFMKDGAGFPLPDGQITYSPAKDGQNVVLTIDQQIQEYVEQALDKANSEYKPQHMTVLVTDPKTGEVLAMADRPDFNPNEYWGITNYLNLAISFPFEPGSTFKIITLAAAIQEGVYHGEEKYASGSYRKIKGKPINDHNNGLGWGNITFAEGVQRSSNVAFVILGYERLKQELLTKYFHDFGIGQLTNIDLPSETKGIMRDLSHPKSERDVAVTTFGQGVAVTAIQQAAAVGAVANGGELLRPRIVKELRDPHTGEVTEKFERVVVRRVVSEQTAKQARDILETVITGEHGTGKIFDLKGYHVAGKTGTAQKYDEKTGKIMEGHYIVSFIGFAPKDNPRLLVYVVVDDPTTDMYYGEMGKKILAPIFNSVMEQSLRYLQQQPDLKELDQQAAITVQKSAKTSDAAAAQPAPVQEVSVPLLSGSTTSVASMKAKQLGLVPKVLGTGTKIVRQIPSEQEKVMSGTEVYLVTDRLTDVKLPDFTGKSLREVMEFASLLKLNVIPTGSGYVRSQNIAPGTAVTGKETLSVTLSPDPSPPE
ncbi:penicillin-binding transpeptidase domain-containing protein [Brevibacillus fluminis]|uniref:penicillin-binding transpeptidase domain-containing protein n=1 Tax=Brevibacillus fluminis TaxID=511487 RepID=UPI003F8C24DF